MKRTNCVIILSFCFTATTEKTEYKSTNQKVVLFLLFIPFIIPFIIRVSHRAALKDQWSLEDLLKNSRPIIASDRGLKVIKKEPMDEKPSIRRTKPGPNSKKYQLANNFRSDKSSNNSTNLCERCSNPRCKKDKKCQGLTATCFKCGLKGHFRGAAKCKFEKKKEKSKKSKKKFRKSRRLEDTSSDEAPSTQSSDSQTDSDSEQDDSGDSSEEEAESKRVTKEFRRPRITTIRLTKESNCRVIRK